MNVKVNPYTYQNRFFNFDNMLLSSSHGWWLIVWVPNTHGFDFIITYVYEKCAMLLCLLVVRKHENEANTLTNRSWVCLYISTHQQQ